MENNNILLPALKEAGVPQEKHAYFLGMLEAYTNKVEEWNVLESIQVADHTDEKAMKIADEHRLKIKRERLEAEKFIKSKREEVQSKMQEFTTEDKALLKIGQHFERVAKSKEESLEFKAKTKERWLAEERQKTLNARKSAIEALGFDPDSFPLSSMDEQGFQTIFDGLKAKKAADEKAAEDARLAEEVRLREQFEEEERQRIIREEQEKIQAEKDKIFQSRREEMSQYFALQYDGKGTITKETSEEDYQKVLANAKLAAQKAEQERLHLIEQQRKTDLFNKNKSDMFRLGFSFQGDYFVFQELRVPESSLRHETFTATAYEKQVADIKKRIDEEREQQRLELLAKEKKEIFNQRKIIFLEMKDYFDEEVTEETTQTEWEGMLAIATEKAEADKKKTILAWVDSFRLPEAPHTENEEEKVWIQEIETKFESFKTWSKKWKNSK